MGKYIIGFVTVILLSLGFYMGAKAQSGSYNSKSAKAIPARDLAISQNKTCILVFPAAIQSADRGAAYILAERVKGSENVLKVKASKQNFELSSLTVITTDGQVFAFKVHYAANPPYLALDLSGEVSGKAAVKLSGVGCNSAELRSAVEKVKRNTSFLKGVHVRKYGLNCQLEGIYTGQDVLFFKFRLRNTSNIGYKVASLRFFIRDLKTARRTAMQDNELESLYRQSWGAPEDEIGQEMVVAIPRFTIADDKSVAIELTEKDGDRALFFRLKERKLRKTRRLLMEQRNR